MSILFEELWQQEVKPHPEYVAGGVLGKGQVMILAAPVWSMKSVVALNMAHQLASGLDFLSTFATPKPCNVLFLDNEIGLTYFQERLKLFYPDTSDLPKGKIRLCSREHESTQFHIDSKSTLDPLPRSHRGAPSQCSHHGLFESISLGRRRRADFQPHGQ